eukprot:COSAG01_NODE_41_length_32446_cov_41.218877_25_plen_64_part_00
MYSCFMLSVVSLHEACMRKTSVVYAANRQSAAMRELAFGATSCGIKGYAVLLDYLKHYYVFIW